MKFVAEKQEVENFNNNSEYKESDGLQFETLNALVKALLYGQNSDGE